MNRYLREDRYSTEERLIKELDKQIDVIIAVLSVHLEQVKKRAYAEKELIDVQLWLIGSIENQIVFLEMQKTKLQYLLDRTLYTSFQLQTKSLNQ